MQFVITGQYIIDYTITLEGESYDVIEADLDAIMDVDVALASSTDQGYTIDHIEVSGATYIVWYDDDIDAEFNSKADALNYMNGHDPKHRGHMYLQEIFGAE